MRVLHAAAELFPLVKTGGLADVLGALPQAQQAIGLESRVLLPGYPAVMQALHEVREVWSGGGLFGTARVRVLQGRLTAQGLDAYVVDAPLLFARAGNPYHDALGREWPDNLQRFALLGWVAAHLASGEIDRQWAPQLLHAHDWHAAMACAYLAAMPGVAARSLYTVHNLAYQGLFDGRDFGLLGLPARHMAPDGLEYHGQVSFMKAGLFHAHHISTVSPRYAREIATPEFGCGLDGLIRQRGESVSGILNGVDPAVWDPARDRALAAPYGPANRDGKRDCRRALQQLAGLRADDSGPLWAVVSRLTAQKGMDLLLQALPRLLADGGQLAMLGSGDAALEQAWRDAAARHPGQVFVRIGYDEPLAHQIVAGADGMLVPSRFEPCGLTQLYALRYGTVPLVRGVGGLADTVADLRADPSAATGFVFDEASVEALSEALGRAAVAWRDPPLWQSLVRRGMEQDFSWAHSAADYRALYQRMLAKT